ncbi:Pol polyprotein [Plakobranchus ocellatus]|uniref:Pol polyprotein n=1 Tax=Plakobranchus ocellatus TaxID=259542 RepID=A0AAV3ZAK6_9GAST|nr:Pol polyprotein [Plakobranchus ocellatus]
MYVLSLIDLATRWAEMVPLHSITAPNVAEGLFSIFSRVGFPIEIQSDRGSQFMSELFAEFTKLAGIKHLFSTPYHPQTNGVVERLHATIKAMLMKLSAHNPAEWDRYLSAVLFAYRQQPHSSTG